MSANVRMNNLEDARRRASSLEVRCSCGQRQVIDLRQLSRLFLLRGWNQDFGNVLYKLKCRRCGRRQPRLKLCEDEPTHQVGPSSEAGWKRLANRARG